MPKKRKHRVVVELTFNEPVLERTATALLRRIMSNNYSDLGLYGRHYKVRSFSHVLAADKR